MQIGKIEYAPNYGRVISVGTHRVRYEHDDVDCDDPGAAARQHVEHNPERDHCEVLSRFGDKSVPNGIGDNLVTTTFGPLHMYGIHDDGEVGPECVVPLRKRILPASRRTTFIGEVPFVPVNDDVRPVASASETLLVNLEGRLKPFSDALVECAKNRGPYLTTFTGRFYFNDPRPEDFEIEDIAHSLAMTRRYSGHGTREYTTAEHSVLIYRWLRAHGRSPDTCLAALLHDAPEALSGFGDAASPRKKQCPAIAAAESLIWRLAIAPKYELSEHIPCIVHDVDKRICHDEMSQNLWEVDPNVGPPLGITLEFWPFEKARAEFLAAFREVQRDRQQRAMVAI